MVGCEQVVVIIGTNITVVAALFLRLRADTKRLKDKMEKGLQSLHVLLRKVETE